MFDRTAASGHTLVEALVMLGIAAILSAAAVPAFSGLLLDSRMNAVVTTSLHAVHAARQLSATRSESVALCGSNDERACSGQVEWAGALLLGNESGSFRRSLPLAGGAGAPRIRTNRATVTFEGGSGFASPATLTICDRRGADSARAVIISRSGRPRSSSRDASDRPLAC